MKIWVYTVVGKGRVERAWFPTEVEAVNYINKHFDSYLMCWSYNLNDFFKHIENPPVGPKGVIMVVKQDGKKHTFMRYTDYTAPANKYSVNGLREW